MQKNHLKNFKINKDPTNNIFIIHDFEEEIKKQNLFLEFSVVSYIKSTLLDKDRPKIPKPLNVFYFKRINDLEENQIKKML